MHDIPENLTSDIPQTGTRVTVKNGLAFDLKALARTLPAGPTLAAFAAVALRHAYGLPIAAAARSTGANTTYTRAAGRLSAEEVPAYVLGKKKLSCAHRRQPDLGELLRQTMQASRDPAVMTDEEHLARIGRERVRAWLDRFTALVVIPASDDAQSLARTKRTGLVHE